MSDYLCLSFRFLAPWFHGRGDESAPEWPPSPLRVFQALVAAAARAGTLDATRSALRWLETRSPPVIFAPAAEPSVGYRLSVPHNAMDLVGRQWAAGKEGEASKQRTMKDVRPLRLPEEAAVHFLWEVSSAERNGARASASLLIAAAKAVVALGWGVDLAVGDGALISATERAALATPDGGPALDIWEPRQDAAAWLRTPRSGSLADLDRHHEAFSRRTSLAEPTFRPPPAVSAFAVTGYAKAGDPMPTRIAAFVLMQPMANQMKSFDTARKAMVVAGMLRHAVREAAERAGWDESRIRGSVLGHGEEPGAPPAAPTAARFVLVPLPSIEARECGGEVVSGVRRVLVMSTDAQSADVDWAQRALGGADLIDEQTGEVVAVLASSSRHERGFARYLGPSRTWATVTPVILPGLDDPGGLRAHLRRTKDPAEQKRILERLARRREALVRKALRHAGVPDDLVFNAGIETRSVGFFAGADRADRYAVPQHLKSFPRLHVRVSWARPVAGPLCVGRGRFFGLGLFASQA
ncbi:MAG: type I-U CRISPR-associated protein Cas5/Cas6 [Myxococcales bacterium]|nr:type I-U CRISPR-associated protein Cas5/Cas6 [Myxococcales bacterium]